MQVTITYFGANGILGGGDDVTTFTKQYSSGTSAWSYYVENDKFTSVAGGVYRFAYSAVSTAGNNLTVGNFIDNPTFGIDAIVVPEPSAAVLGLLGVTFLMRRRR